jgi:hypothetical protein
VSLLSLVTVSWADPVVWDLSHKFLEMEDVRGRPYTKRLVEIIIVELFWFVVQTGQSSASIIAETGDVRQ